MSQLEYMHREFKKLERQLLGAKTTAKNLTESVGSKERREKLHSFIVHLEDTMQQIQTGCSLEERGLSTVGVVAISSSTGGTGTIHNKRDTNHHEGKSSDDPSQTTTLEIIQEEVSVEDEKAKKEFARSSALTKMTKEKEEEESVQKLEEHILANLLPVKERLMKQLAAQQGASKNPIGMPVNRRGLLPPGTSKQSNPSSSSYPSETIEMRTTTAVGGTVALQASIAESAVHGPLHPASTGPVTVSQYGQPVGGGSSLTQKLHGKTLGSTNQTVPKASESNPNDNLTTPVERKVMYAGMTPGSRQVQSGVSAAAGVHDLVIENETYIKPTNANIQQNPPVEFPIPPPPPASVPAAIPQSSNTKLSIPLQTSVPSTYKPSVVLKATAVSTNKPVDVQLKTTLPHSAAIPIASSSISTKPVTVKKVVKEPILTKSANIDMNTSLAQRQRPKGADVNTTSQSPAAASATLRRVSKPASVTKPSASTGPKKGPISVEYICALCNETYKSTSEYNPWYSLQSQECVKCGKTQIPRLDISSPANAIDYHPALLVHAACEESGKSSNKAPFSIPKHLSVQSNDAFSSDCGAKNSSSYLDLNEDLDFDLSDEDDDDMLFGEGDEDDDGGADDDDDSIDLSPSARAENEDFGKNYDGPVFSEYDASRLLILMSHASTCPGQHKNTAHKNACINAKFMMMHVRDCPGTTISFDICPYPWCRKTKHLLYHLVSCQDPNSCEICNPQSISCNLRALKGLNAFRKDRIRQRFCAPVAAISSTNSEGVQVKSVGGAQPSAVSTTGKKPNNTKRVGKTTAIPIRTNKPLVPGFSTKSNSAPVSKVPFSVPSPIPTIVDGPSVNALKSHPMSQLKRTDIPVSSSTLKSGSRQITQSTTARLITGTANPLATSTVAPVIPAKLSSPPNPLKGLPRDSPPESFSRTTAISHFPSLPTQIDSDESLNSRKNESTSVEIKVDGSP